MLLLLLQEHTNTIRRFQFVSLQEAAAYVAKVRGTVLCAMSGSLCTTCFSCAMEHCCCFVGASSFQHFMTGSNLLRGAQAEKPDQRGAQQQELTAAQPSMPWSQILESLELTEHQRKVRSQIQGPPWTESCAQSQVLCN